MRKNRKYKEHKALFFAVVCLLVVPWEALLYQEETCSLSLTKLEKSGPGAPAHPGPDLLPVLPHTAMPVGP